MPHAAAEDDIYNGFFIPKGWYSHPTNLYRCWLICIFRCGGNCELMVRYLHYYFLLGSNLFVGRSFTTRSCTQSRMPSNQSDSSTQMEACVRIRYCHRHLDLENGSALGDTWPIPRCLLLLLLCSQFSTSRRAKTALVEGLTCTHSQAAA
jgi:hypothetical protein